MKYSVALNRSEKWDMPKAHQHDFVEMLLFLNDGGSFFLQDSVFPLKRGSLIIVQENISHRSIVTGNTYERYVLHIPRKTLIDASDLKTDFSILFKENYCFQLGGTDFEKLRSLMEKCSVTPKEFGDDVLRNCAFLTLLVFVAKLLPASVTASGFHRGLSSSIGLAIDWINSHLDEDLSLDTLSSQCYVTKYYLCRLFKDETGFTVGEYILQQRLLRACSLLRKGESVQKVGEAVGFRNYNHFIRTFSQYMGISPGRYRTKSKAE
ncbi:MAG: helix-turn-helix transcriptional regulator [Clostridia bacterium]|nr:helix-turn-helix transcriptional regulator [Clostridia bacterium]